MKGNLEKKSILVALVGVLAFGAVGYGYRHMEDKKETKDTAAASVVLSFMDEELNVVNVTSQVRQEKVLDLLEDHEGEGTLTEETEGNKEQHPGDLKMTMTDSEGKSCDIYLSKGGDYYYSELGDGLRYEIPNGEELYEELAEELQGGRGSSLAT